LIADKLCRRKTSALFLSLAAAVARRSAWNRDLHFGTRFQLDLFAVLVGQRVLDTDLLRRVIGPFDSDLCFVRFAGKDFMIVSTVPDIAALDCSVMSCPLGFQHRTLRLLGWLLISL
jgi:hypothetical protein